MIERILTCPKCKGTSFTIKMKYKQEDEMRLLMCHDGYGFQMEEAIWECNKCKNKNYDNLTWVK